MPEDQKKKKKKSAKSVILIGFLFFFLVLQNCISESPYELWKANAKLSLLLSQDSFCRRLLGVGRC